MRTALGYLHVVEVGDDCAAYAGRLFAGLGARVTRLLPPAGMRLAGLHIDPDPVVHEFLNRGKAEVVLPESVEERRREFGRLVDSADLLIESGRPDILDQLGIPADHPCLARSSLVRTRISPWGVAGPHALDPASDLVVSAAAGFLLLGGWPDRAPTRAFGDQSWRMASLYAAAGAMLALIERDRSGCGQQVEVSAQEAVGTALENALQYFDLEGTVRGRTGAGYSEAGSGVYKCGDGYVYVMVGRLSTAQGWSNLLDWLDEVGAAGADELRAPQWSEYAYRRTPEAQRRFREIFEAFAKDRSKAYLYVEGQRRSIAICPINTPSDLLANEHLRERGFFVERDGRRLVGAPFRLSATPWSLEDKS